MATVDPSRTTASGLLMQCDFKGPTASVTIFGRPRGIKKPTRPAHGSNDTARKLISTKRTSSMSAYDSDDSQSLTRIACSTTDDTELSPAVSHCSVRKLWHFRFLVQSNLLDPHSELKPDLLAVSDQLRMLEQIPEFHVEAVRRTGIIKVLKDILKLAHIPQKELQLKKRSVDLLEKLTDEHDRSVNMRNGQLQEPVNRIIPHAGRRSNCIVWEHGLRRSRRIARKNPRRSTRIATRNPSLCN